MTLETFNIHRNFQERRCQECSNHRATALMSQASEVMLKGIQQRPLPHTEQDVPDVQTGFWEGRGTWDLSVNIGWIWESSREFQDFTNCSKAIDYVDVEKLWVALEELGASQHLIILKRNLYCGQEATIRIECGETEWFAVGKGARRRCILSPFLFNLYTYCIIQKTGLH